LEQMAAYDEFCDHRIEESSSWCLPNCPFHSLCRKPIRFPPENDSPADQFEIAIESTDEMMLLK
jgi:hypothetical protein